MKKLTAIVLITMGVVILLGSVSHSWAGDNKRNFRFNFIYNEQGAITGVERWDPKKGENGQMTPVPEYKDPINGVIKTATIMMLNTDDPCIVISGKTYCW